MYGNEEVRLILVQLQAAGLEKEWPEIAECFRNDTAVAAASDRIDAICEAHPHSFW